jgi:hypothetical protein
MPSVLSVLLILAAAAIQQAEPTVSKDAISVHRVERGTMPLRETVTGAIVSIEPARAEVTLAPRQRDLIKPGQTCSIQVVAPGTVAGRVLRITGPDAQGSSVAQLEFSNPFPQGTAVGTRIGGLIDVGEAKDVLFFGRPADARPNTTAMAFVVELGGDHARRVEVKYGRVSGALIEILSGLSEGDRVIVTDMSKWAGSDRVRLR